MLGEKPNKRGWRRARLIKSEVADDSYPTMILTPTSGTCLWVFFCVLCSSIGKRACVIFSHYLVNLCADFAIVVATVVFFPVDYLNSGNLHKLVAETPCVMLDVLLPPYCEEGSRLCTFYKPRIDLNEVKIGEELMLEKILSTA